MNRRDLVMGGACALAAGAAYQLTPRKTLNLMGRRRIEDVIPSVFGGWASHGDENLVQPLTKGSLADRLYSQTVARIYSNTELDTAVMMMVAYGDNQSDMLQLHRPEACYPAVGFRVVMSDPATVALSSRVTLPVRRVTVEMTDRRENIVYWTRLGEYLPTDSTDQGRARLRTAMQGYVADGGLFRCSAIASTDEIAFRQLDSFIAELMAAVAPADRPAMLGTNLARGLNA